MYLASDGPYQSLVNRRRTSHAAPARSDHAGVGPRLRHATAVLDAAVAIVIVTWLQ
jgi:hypothetical protein